MRKNISIVLVSLVLLFFYGCPNPSIPTSISEKAITSFIFINLNPAVKGIITGTTIKAAVPYGTDVTNLVAVFTTTGTSVSVGGITLNSGTTVNDFTNPVTYTVTAEDGTTQDYTVEAIFPAAAIEDSGFTSATIPGDSGKVTLSESKETITMINANNSENMTFPTGTDDSTTTTLTTKFFIAETETTNTVVAAVFKWAYNNGKFSSTVTDPNGLNTITVKHGGQELLDLGNSDCHVHYDGLGRFYAEGGYEKKPVTNISWYGAVMVCNWLTEMRDGNNCNVVYTNIDTAWIDDETIENVSRNGYRLPSYAEWEYAARYRGSDSTNTVSGYNNPHFTRGDSASNAIDGYYSPEACQTVAVCSDLNPRPGDEAVVKSLGSDSANTLGIYDMSGNVFEWCFTENGYYRASPGCSWVHADTALQVGQEFDTLPDRKDGDLGFRLCRTAATTVSSSSAKGITSFNFETLYPSVKGTITGTGITVTVPYGTNISNLAATFTTTGASVRVNGTVQVSGTTVNDFTSPIIYRVTAADGTIQDYTVNVIIAAPAAAENSGFISAANIGDLGLLTLSESGKTINMIYANNSTSNTFPTGTDDSTTATLTKKFFAAETEVTNAIMAEVLQWAYDNGRFSTEAGDPNSLDYHRAKHGGQVLINLDLNHSDIHYHEYTYPNFKVDNYSSVKNKPATYISWYGAVMFCNWLTEMRDGNTENVVYTGIDTSWQSEETVENIDKPGYRLLSSNEWEYAARYRGSDSTNTVSGYVNPYYTKGNSASGATTYYNDNTNGSGEPGKSAINAVAVYYNTNISRIVKSCNANTLGLYDMSGNAWEWCFTGDNNSRIMRGGSWGYAVDYLQIGFLLDWYSGDHMYYDTGFRFCRTAN